MLNPEMIRNVCSNLNLLLTAYAIGEPMVLFE